jgi:uncharacterized membrane protein YfcA
MIFTTLFGSISFALTHTSGAAGLTLGFIHLDTALVLFCGSALFARYGVKINQQLSLYWRKTALGLLLLLICLRLIIMLINQ